MELYERVTLFRESGAGLSLWANAVKALNYLELGQAMRALALPETAGGIRTASGDLLMSTANAQLARPVRRSQCHGAPRRVARSAAPRPRPGTTPGYGVRGRNRRSPGVRVRFGNGTEAVGDLVIGADGPAFAGAGGLAWATAAPVLRVHGPGAASCPFAHSGLQSGESGGRGARFGQIPMQGGQRLLVRRLQYPRRSTRPGSAKKAELLRIYGDWHDRIRTLIEATPETAILRNDIHDRPPLKQWGRGPG